MSNKLWNGQRVAIRCTIKDIEQRYAVVGDAVTSGKNPVYVLSNGEHVRRSSVMRNRLEFVTYHPLTRRWNPSMIGVRWAEKVVDETQPTDKFTETKES